MGWQELPQTRATKRESEPELQEALAPATQSELQHPGGEGKLENKIAVVTGGDSGVGQAVAIAFAAEGADIAIIYLNEHVDAHETQQQVERYGRRCLLIPGDIGQPELCEEAIAEIVEAMGRVDILVNSAAELHPQEKIEDISDEQLQRTFQTNIFGAFYLVQAALKYMKAGSAIINTASLTVYRGHPQLLDYSAAKGALVAFTRSLALNLAERAIRVNAVAPGPLVTPLIAAAFPEKKIEQLTSNVPLGRPGEPEEIASCYVFLASSESSYMTGQVLHPNGGEIING
jgi:NAD(P)-dependent dehydrogenase (short-subunit alcohol dehydrogenase family)